MGDKSENAMEKQGSRTRNVYAKEKNKLDKARRDSKEDYRRNWEMEAEKTKRKEKMISSRSSEETPLQSIKENKQVPRVKSGLRRGPPSHGIISEVFIIGLASTPIYGMEIAKILLLRSALHPLGTAGHVIIILVHTGRGRTVRAGLVVLVLGVLKLEILDHGVGRGNNLLGARRKDLLKEFQILELLLLGELDVELDVQVAVVVVAERGHTLAVENLDGI